MRDRTRQAGDHRSAEALTDWLVEPLVADDQPAADRARRRRIPEDVEPNNSERITLIEFMWQGQTGAQQVILVSREWLQ